MNTTAIAQHLNVAEAAIVEVQEWARVLWVRVKGLGARFVSKKVTKMEAKTYTVSFKGMTATIPAQDGLHEIPGSAFQSNFPSYVLVRGAEAICMKSEPKTTDWNALGGSNVSKDIEDGVIVWC